MEKGREWRGLRGRVEGKREREKRRRFKREGENGELRREG